jgi:hypothetical protein
VTRESTAPSRPAEGGCSPTSRLQTPKRLQGSLWCVRIEILGRMACSCSGSVLENDYKQPHIVSSYLKFRSDRGADARFGRKQRPMFPSAVSHRRIGLFRRTTNQQIRTRQESGPIIVGVICRRRSTTTGFTVPFASFLPPTNKRPQDCQRLEVLTTFCKGLRSHLNVDGCH